MGTEISGFSSLLIWEEERQMPKQLLCLHTLEQTRYSTCGESDVRQVQRLPDPTKRIIMGELGIPAEAFGGMSSGSPDYRRSAGSAPSGVTYCAM
jgi:hypothetical protein